MDKPINLKAHDVRAIIDGRKTQHRVVLKPQPDTSKISPPFHPEHRIGRKWVFMARDDFPSYSFATGDFVAPYATGMRLWVRETWASINDLVHNPADIIYRADPNDGWRHGWHSSTSLPRWASRLTLIVKDVRVQRLQEISEEDAIAEGIYWSKDFEGWTSGAGVDESCDFHGSRPDVAYSKLWGTIHGPGAWNDNPWICAITFETHRANIDAIVKDAAP